MNKCPWVRLVNRLCDLHEAIAVVRIAKTVPEHDGKRSWRLGFPSRKGVLRREREGGGHSSQEEREGGDVHVCRGWRGGDFGGSLLSILNRAARGSPDRARGGTRVIHSAPCNTIANGVVSQLTLLSETILPAASRAPCPRGFGIKIHFYLSEVYISIMLIKTTLSTPRSIEGPATP